MLFAERIQQNERLIGIGASQAHHHRHVDLHLDCSVNNALSDCVALHDTSEDVYKNGLNLWVLAQNLEGGLDLLGVGTTTDVEEVGSFASVQGDDVHSGHGETRTVDHAADVAVKSDVVETSFNGLLFVDIIVSC